MKEQAGYEFGSEFYIKDGITFVFVYSPLLNQKRGTNKIDN